jgi:hypothetical protein
LGKSTISSTSTPQWNGTTDTAFEFVNIQVQDQTGMWRTTATSQNEPQLYLTRMQEAAYMHPDKRVRTVNKYGRVIDLL